MMVNLDDLVKSHEWKLPAVNCRESSTVRNISHFLIRSLIPQQAAGNALAVQYNYRWLSKKVHIQGVIFFQERGYTCSMPSV